MKYLADDVDPETSDRLGGYLDADPETDIDARLDPSNLEVYACGVTAMVDTLVEAVGQAGVPPEHVQGEGYG